MLIVNGFVALCGYSLRRSYVRPIYASRGRSLNGLIIAHVVASMIGLEIATELSRPVLLYSYWERVMPKTVLEEGAYRRKDEPQYDFGTVKSQKVVATMLKNRWLAKLFGEK